MAGFHKVLSLTDLEEIRRVNAQVRKALGVNLVNVVNSDDPRASIASYCRQRPAQDPAMGIPPCFEHIPPPPEGKVTIVHPFDPQVYVYATPGEDEETATRFLASMASSLPPPVVPLPEEDPAAPLAPPLTTSLPSTVSCSQASSVDEDAEEDPQNRCDTAARRLLDELEGEEPVAGTSAAAVAGLHMLLEKLDKERPPAPHTVCTSCGLVHADADGGADAACRPPPGTNGSDAALSPPNGISAYGAAAAAMRAEAAAAEALSRTAGSGGCGL